MTVARAPAELTPAERASPSGRSTASTAATGG